jgi:glutaredoxin 3
MATANVVVYATQWCPFCVRARQLLEHKQVAYELIDVGQEPARRGEMMSRAAGAHTVPQIFINGEHIGGCDDLYALERAQQLDSKLAPNP